MSFSPDGFLLSNGPGDPSAMKDVIKLVKRITHSKKPVFGICLGHQILALSEGISTFKMHNGHRGINHPVKNLKTGLCEITSQNHGFGVNEDDIKKNKNVEVTHINLNDGTIEGIKLIDKDCFQYNITLRHLLVLMTPDIFLMISLTKFLKDVQNKESNW